VAAASAAAAAADARADGNPYSLTIYYLFNDVKHIPAPVGSLPVRREAGFFLPLIIFRPAAFVFSGVLHLIYVMHGCKNWMR
jgi:hypothetical protein